MRRDILEIIDIIRRTGHHAVDDARAQIADFAVFEADLDALDGGLANLMASSARERIPGRETPKNDQ